jgi:thiol-disulfide isomerase/thioredoxin
MEHSKCGDEMECIEDFAGNMREPGRWADWCPTCKVVVFGGYWREIPDLPSNKMLDEDDSKYLSHIKKWQPKCEESYQAWLNKAWDDDVQETGDEHISENTSNNIRKIIKEEIKNILMQDDYDTEEPFQKS